MILLSVSAYYPTVGMRVPGDSITTNFGTSPFAFDISGFVQVSVPPSVTLFRIGKSC